MREMGWSWTELQKTPLYVRRFVWDLIGARRAAEDAAGDRPARE